MQNPKRAFRLRGALSLLLALTLLCALLPPTVQADEAQYTVSEFHYTSTEDPSVLVNEGSFRADRFIWSDSWFFTDGTAENAHLCALSAAAALSSNACQCESADDFSQRDKTVREFLAAMGFADIETNDWYRQDNLPDSAACAVAYKTITYGGESAALLAVVPMSAGYRQEWMGDFNVGESGLHAGFQAGRDEILRFVKQYALAHGLSGELKVWIPGHSRGAGLANLLGAFFAEGGADYFSGLHFRPENVYCYAFATPSTLDGSATRGALLSVGGNRADSPYDTPGAPYVYSGADAAAPADPGAAVYRCVHNFRADNDLFTLLPPSAWGFTVFGAQETLRMGDAAEKARMELLLASGDSALYEQFRAQRTLAKVIPTGSTGDPDEYEWKKLDWSAKAIVGDGALRLREMEDARVAGLSAVAPERAIYAAQYQETACALAGVYGMSAVYLSEQLGLSAVWPLLVNYLAYASGRIGGENADARAVTEVSLGLYEYLSGESLDGTETSFSDFVEKLLTALGGNEKLMTLLGLAEAGGGLPEALTKAVKDLTGGSVHDLLLAFVSEDADTAAAARKNVFKALWTLLPENRRERLTAFGYDSATGTFNGTQKKLYPAVKTLLPLLLRNGDRTIAEAADAQLAGLLKTLQSKTLKAYRADGFPSGSVSRLSGCFDTCAAHPAQVRELLMNFLFRTGESYSFPDELRTAVTFAVQAGKIPFAHFNEMYLAWARARDSAWVIGDLPSGSYDTPQTLRLHSAAAEIRYTTDGSAPNAQSPLYTAAGVALPPAGSACGIFPVRAAAFENGAPAGPVWEIGSYELLHTPVVALVTMSTAEITGAAGQEYVLAEKGRMPDWSKAIQPTDGVVRFTGLTGGCAYIVHTRLVTGSGKSAMAQFSTPLISAAISGDLVVGALVRVNVEPEDTGDLKYRWYCMDAPTDGSAPDLSRLRRIYTANTAFYLVTALDLGKLLYARVYAGDTELALVAAGAPGYASVEFESNGGSAVKSVTGLLFNSRIEQPPNPVRSGYSFGGWYEDQALTKPWDFMKDGVLRSRTVLYARWLGDGDSGAGETEYYSYPVAETEYSRTPEKGSDAVELRAGDCVVRLDAAAVRKAAAGEIVDVRVRENGDGTTTIDVTALGKHIDVMMRVAMPAARDTLVLTLVRPDGKEEPVKKSLAENGTVYALFPSGATIRQDDGAKAFPDVSESAWYAPAVRFVSSHGLFQGTLLGFEPDKPMNRAMLAAVLCRLEDASAAGTAAFPDVAQNAWYADAVSWAAEAGIVKGTDRGFLPEEPVTREQIAVMLCRYAQLLGLDTSGRAGLDGFADGARTADWARDAMDWAVAAGLFRGNTDGLLNPKGSASRAEVATLLQRMVSLIVK